MRLLLPLLAITALCVLSNCSAEQGPKQAILDTYPSFETNERLKELIGAAPIQQINIDKLTADTIHMSDENLMGMPNSPEAPLLGRAIGMVAVEDSFYIADKDHQALVVMNEEGKLLHTLGRRGSGPGEYQDIRAITRNSDYIFVSDLKKAEMQVFRPDYEYVTAINGDFFSPTANIAVNDDQLLMAASVEDSLHLIESRQPNPPFNKEETFFPQLIPMGYQPRSYNTYLVSMNNQGEVITCYPGLPFIFLYNKDLEHTGTIAIQSEHFESLDNTPVTAVPSIERASVSWFLQNLYLNKNGDIYFNVDQELFRLTPSGESKYHVANKISFKNKKDLINNSRILLTDDFLYLTSRFEEYIYKVKLSKVE